MKRTKDARTPQSTVDSGRRLFLRSATRGLSALAVANALGLSALAQPNTGGFIVVRLKPGRFGSLLVSAPDLRTLAQGANAPELLALLNRFPQLPARHLVSALTATQVAELETRAERRGNPRRWSLNSYWRIAARTDAERTQLLQLLRSVPDVDLVYEQPKGSDPTVDSSDDQFAAQQFHLAAAPMGVDAKWAWTQPGGDGATVAFVDVEQGWIFNHEDLPMMRTLPGVSWEVTTTSRPHGTAVVSLAAGRDNATGVVGVAPNPAWVSVSSHVRQGVPDQVADAISAAAFNMAAGDVLLVEWQDSNNLPAEVTPDIWTAISLATASGIIVVECAGNGNRSLDGFAAIKRDSPSTDSGAIIVGAARRALDASGTGHNRLEITASAGSNHGERVDCYAIGEQLGAAGPSKTAAGSLTPAGTAETMAYRKDFGLTSGSAPIVAGAAVALQGMHKAVKGTPLSPAEMRTALSTHGTPQGTGVAGRIGVMPDLRKAAISLGLPSVPSSPTSLRIGR